MINICKQCFDPFSVQCSEAPLYLRHLYNNDVELRNKNQYITNYQMALLVHDFH